jgi:hypothetical protein
MSDPGTQAGFTDEEKNDLRELIKEVVGSATPPATTPTGPPAVTDADWDKMTDRARESWVRDLVDGKLNDLVKLDADKRRDDEIASLKKAKEEGEQPPADAPPRPIDKLRKFLWGSGD